MASTAISACSLQANRFLEFLRDELTPTPGRWQATLRITLACVAASFPVMAFQLHEPLIVMILMFLVTRQDTTARLLVTVIGIIGVTIGCRPAAAYLCMHRGSHLAASVVGSCLHRVGTVHQPDRDARTCGLHLWRTACPGHDRSRYHSFDGILTRCPFYVWWAAVLGLGVSLGVQYLLNPVRAQSVLVRGLTSRLEAVEAALLRLAAEEHKQPPPVSLVSLALKGAAERLHLLKLASIAEPGLKQNQAEIGAQIVLVDRLVTATCVLEEQGVGLRQ